LKEINDNGTNPDSSDELRTINQVESPSENLQKSKIEIALKIICLILDIPIFVSLAFLVNLPYSFTMGNFYTRMLLFFLNFLAIFYLVLNRKDMYLKEFNVDPNANEKRAIIRFLTLFFLTTIGVFIMIGTTGTCACNHNYDIPEGWTIYKYRMSTAFTRKWPEDPP